MFGTTNTTSTTTTSTGAATIEGKARGGGASSGATEARYGAAAAGAATSASATNVGGVAERNVEAYDERGSGDGGPERRRSTREPLVTRGTLKAVTGLATEPPLEVLVVDVSLHGVGLRSAESLEVGDLYHVEIGAGPLHLTSRARIVRCRLRRDGNFDIGAEFC